MNLKLSWILLWCFTQFLPILRSKRDNVTFHANVCNFILLFSSQRNVTWNSRLVFSKTLERCACVFFFTAGDKWKKVECPSDEEIEEERFVLLNTQIFFSPINKNYSNYQIVKAHHVLLPPFAITIKPLINLIHTDID